MARARNFDDWFESNLREQWKISAWDVSKIQLSSNAKDLLREEFGSTKCYSWMSADAGDFRDNDWILCIRDTGSRLGGVNWMFAHHVVQVPRAERKELNDGLAVQVLQIGTLKRYEKPPFSLVGKKIQQAIRKAYRETQPSNSKATVGFINAIRRYYNR